MTRPGVENSKGGFAPLPNPPPRGRLRGQSPRSNRNIGGPVMVREHGAGYSDGRVDLQLVAPGPAGLGGLAVGRPWPRGA